MTKTVSLSDASIQAVIALVKNGDVVIIEDNGEPLVKFSPIEKSETKQRVSPLKEEE